MEVIYFITVICTSVKSAVWKWSISLLLFVLQRTALYGSDLFHYRYLYFSEERWMKVIYFITVIRTSEKSAVWKWSISLPLFVTSEKSPPLLQRDGPPRDYVESFNMHHNYQGRTGHLMLPPDPRAGLTQPSTTTAAATTINTATGYVMIRTGFSFTGYSVQFNGVSFSWECIIIMVYICKVPFFSHKSS